MTNKALHPRYPLNGTVGKSNDEELTTHLYNIKATIAIRCADEGGARHLFGRITDIAHKKGIKLAYMIDEVIDMGEVKDDLDEDIHRKLEIMIDERRSR